MMPVVRGLASGAATGLVLGVLVRALMRLVAIGMAIEPEFHLGASIAIISLFVVSGAGAGAARALELDGWRAALVIALSSAPLLLVGTVFAIGEVGDILDRDLTAPWKFELLAMSTVILGTALVTPYAGWRAGRGRGRAAREVATGSYLRG